MVWLILGLVLFLGMHSARVFAEGARTRFVAQRGPNAWKGLYSVVSLVGFVLLMQGYGLARQQPVVLWVPPTGLRHAASLLGRVVARHREEGRDRGEWIHDREQRAEGQEGVLDHAWRPF